MRSSDTCFSLTHVNSIPQFPPTCHNVPAQTSQINFQQQHQQQQQSTNQQQPMQCQQHYCYPANQQAGGMGPQNQYVQPYQQDPYIVGQQQHQQHQQQPIQRSGLGNHGQALGHAPFAGPSIMQPQAIGYGSLPAYVLADQARTYFGAPQGPIFILPNNCPNPSSQPTQQVVPANPSINQGCPGIGINCPASGSHGCPVASCCPYPVPMPMYNPYFQASSPSAARDTKSCGCCPRKAAPQDGPNASAINWSRLRYANETTEEHRCAVTTDETICPQRNCPSAISLQALASQLLAIPGIVSCAATRLILRKIPGSDITTSMEETIERAKRSLTSLTKDQLLSETRASQQINALINLHMTANPPMNVIPILTTLQLKVNLLKAQVDASLNRRLIENQGLGVSEGAGNLDPVMLATKTDQELRDLLGTLRQKECDERVNYNFAPYKSQRVIAESRLTNVQNKIAQIEEEMDRRRAAILPGSSMISGRRVSHQSSDPGCAAWYGYPGDIGNTGWTAATHQSPDPFCPVQVRNPKRLNLKAHVGSPETTYENPVKTSGLRASSRSTRRNSDEDQDREDAEKHAKRSSSDERRCCNCDKSSDDDSPDEGKKKPGVKIRGRRIVSARGKEETGGNSGGVSVVKLSRRVTIVIDDTGNATRDDCHRHDRDESRTGRAAIEDEGREDSFEPASPSAPGEDDEETPTKDDLTKSKGARVETKPPDETIGATATSGESDEDNLASTEQDVNKMESSVYKMEYDVDKMAAAKDKMATAKDKVAAAEGKVVAAEDKMVAAEDKMVAAEDKMVAAEDKMAAAKDKMAVAEDKMAAAEDKMAAAEDKMAAAEDKMAGVKYKMAASEDKMVAAEDKMAGVDKMEDTHRTNESTASMETSTNGTDPNSENTRPGTIREETVRMITNIQYEPSVFRGFGSSDKCEEKVVEERYKGRPFTEDSSLKSTSTESTVTSNLTTESVLLRADNCEETLDVATQHGKSWKNLETLAGKEPRSDGLKSREFSENNDVSKIRSSSEIDVPMKSDEASRSARPLLSVSSDNEARNDLISGALSTIGNHVASFGSLIGKIATLKLHRSDDSSHETLPESENFAEDDAFASGSRDATGSSDDTRKKIGRWRYIRFSDVPESTGTSVENVNTNRDAPTYTLPRLKHSVIEDKSTGGRYVVMATTTTTRQSNDRRLGEPYKTGRSLVIRSRPKSPTTAEQSDPFAVVAVPRRRDKNCIALSLADVRALTKNRSKPANKEIKTSDKFWLKPETTGRNKRAIKGPEVARGKKAKSLEQSANNSTQTSNDESVVRIHEYSKILGDP